jgi:CheY-like chemotaxis protein
MGEERSAPAARLRRVGIATTWKPPAAWSKRVNEHTVLVVEDDPEIRESLVDLLEGQGYGVVAAANGREALRLLRSRSPTPCLILLDLMMPVMDGRTFRAEQLRSPDLASIPVVVVSAYRDVEESARALQVREFLEKPFDLDHLMGVAKRYCRGGDAPCNPLPA